MIGHIDCEFSPDSVGTWIFNHGANRGEPVTTSIHGQKNLDCEIRRPARVSCFDNNLIGSWMLICSQLRLELGTPR